MSFTVRALQLQAGTRPQPAMRERSVTPFLAVPAQVPAPDSVPPVDNPDPQPGDPQPKTPPSGDDEGKPIIPVELPGQPHAPERV